MAKNLFSGLFGKKKADTEEPLVDAPPDTKTAREAAEPPSAAEPAAVAEAARAGSEAEPVPSETSAPALAPLEPAETKKGFFSRLRDGLTRSSTKLSADVGAIFTTKKLDGETLEELEEALIAADLGVATAARVCAALSRDRFNKEITGAEVRAALASVVGAELAPLEVSLEIDRAKKPHVILMAGVNGAGKTTTIGKLAAKFQAEDLSVMLAAGDTFRAAAIEQLTVWGDRAGVPVVAREVGADAAGLAYDALRRAKAEGRDVLLIDTAGRLQNRRELMDELAKIVRVLKKLDETAPHSTLLVLDATVGQNALSQAEVFRDIAGVTGLVMTKLDGTARGGVLVALGEKFNLPIHYIGVGEGVDDLQPFRAAGFARALAGIEDESGSA